MGKERDHDAVARIILERAGLIEKSAEAEDERKEGRVRVERVSEIYDVLEVLKFLLGERATQGNIFKGEEARFDVFVVKANFEREDRLICFSERAGELYIFSSKVEKSEQEAGKQLHIVKYGEAVVFEISDIVRVGFCIETGANGEKSRFVQFDVERNGKRESLRVYEYGKIIKWP